MSNEKVTPDFEQLYRDTESSEDLPAMTPWDIGGPQPVIEQLVASGALLGEVLDPGTGPGHHAIHYASKGYSTTGIDASTAGIERARRNAEHAGVQVNFEVADATALTGFEGRFDTVVDSSFYHVFLDDEDTQSRYARALHRATKAGARLFMFEFGCHNVNGLSWFGLPAENFERVLPAAGWRIDYLGPTTYLANFTSETFSRMSEGLSDNRDLAARVELMLKRFSVIEPLLDHERVHVPYWAVHATRLD